MSSSGKLVLFQCRIVALLTIILSLLLLLQPSFAFAKKGKFYAVASAGYAFNDVYDANIDELAYKVNIAYGLADQWTLEFGAQLLASAELSSDELMGDLVSLETDIAAIQISALGKASNNHGELFYRIGVAQILPDTVYQVSSDNCRFENSTSIAMNTCENNESQWAGILGIGFDYYIHHSVLLRVEAEHIQGQDDFTSQAFYLGLRYNF